jgi:RNA polymerase primary sigma factor
MKGIRITERFTKRETPSFKKYLSDISEIKMLTLEEETNLSLKAENGDKSAIDGLVRHNLRFVISVAKQYETQNIDLEDLVNEGNIGLIIAAQRYKVSTGFKFITFAVFWIRKMIMEYLTKNSKLVRLPSNKVNDLSKLNQHVSELEQKFGRTVDISEVIEEYGDKFTQEEISDLENVAMLKFDSLDGSIDDGGEGTNLYDVLENSNSKPSDYLLTESDIKYEISKILDKLKPRDRQIMVDLFGINGDAPLTLKEVSDKIGLTREMVRQIKMKSLEKLKKSNILII